MPAPAAGGDTTAHCPALAGCRLALVVLPHPAPLTVPLQCLLTYTQTSTEVFFRKAKFWDGEGKDAPPAFHVDGVQYLHVKVGAGR